MKRNVKYSIRLKILLLILPILICSFVFSGIISVSAARNNILQQSSIFIRYKIEQMTNYTTSQWLNFIKSDFYPDPAYEQIVKDSLKSYADSMIMSEYDLILTVDYSGNLVFSTDNSLQTQNSKASILLSEQEFSGSILSEYEIADAEYVGMSRFIQGIDWKIFVLVNEQEINSRLRTITLFQVITFLISILMICFGVFVSINIIIVPLTRMKKTIEDIIKDRDFSRSVKIQYPDELGDLALTFNNLTSNLDLAHKKLKNSAVSEAVARKEVYLREIEALEVLARASDYKDSDTGAHLKRVSGYSLIISEALGFNDAYNDLLYHSAPLHDIGKLGIPDSIILKPSPLNDEEFEKIKEHTTLGHDILNNFSSKYLKAGAVIAWSHHEYFNGTGYPRQLSGNDIPIFGRIVTIADVFDALTSVRPYKKAWSFDDAISSIREQSGKQFDPDLVKIFIENISRVKAVFEDNIS